MIAIRMMFTRTLIRVAMKTCVLGPCYDHLEAAFKWERDWP